MNRPPVRSARMPRRGIGLITALVSAGVLGCGSEDTGSQADAPVDGRQRDAPAAVVHEPAGRFRGGRLPKTIDRADAPQFRLADARGGTIDTRELAGRPYVVTFLFTDCEDVCPLIGQELRLALEALGDRGREVTVVAVSADPAGDTAASVRKWLHTQSMPPNFRYAIGAQEELAPVWKAHYAAAQPDDKSESAHTTSIWLVDRAGRWRTKFSGGVAIPPSDIAHDLRILLDERA